MQDKIPMQRQENNNYLFAIEGRLPKNKGYLYEWLTSP